MPSASVVVESPKSRRDVISAGSVPKQRVIAYRDIVPTRRVFFEGSGSHTDIVGDAR